MKKNLQKLLIVMLLFVALPNLTRAQIVGAYIGSDVYSSNSTLINEMKTSGFNTIIVWTIQLDNNGNIYLNGTNAPIVVDRQFRAQTLKNNLNALKQNSTITRLELSIGAAQSEAFNIIRTMHQTQSWQFSPGGQLYDNFQILRNELNMLDAINNDDEVTYDVASSVEFTKMCARIGFRNTIVPYRNANTYWRPLVEQVNAAYPGNIELNYIQGYDGGTGNTPCQSEWNFGIPNVIGLKYDLTPQQIQNSMAGWENTCSSQAYGGFLWSYLGPALLGRNVVEYANAIRNGSNGSPAGSSVTNVALNKAVFSDSEWSGAFLDDFINDGNRSTRWASASTGQTHWLYYDLGAYYNISDVILRWETAIGRHIVLWTLNSNNAWEPFYSNTNNFNFTNNISNVNRTARYISISTYAAPYNHISLFEFEVFGTFSYNGKKLNSKDELPGPPPLLNSSLSVSKNIFVYPNPAKDNFNIALTGFKKAEITISDLLGKTVYQTTTTNTELNLQKGNTFKSGMYIITAVDENNEQHISKLIIK